MQMTIFLLRIKRLIRDPPKGRHLMNQFLVQILFLTKDQIISKQLCVPHLSQRTIIIVTDGKLMICSVTLIDYLIVIQVKLQFLLINPLAS